MLEGTPNQTFKFKRKSWVETNDDLRRMYNTNSQLDFKKLLKLLNGRKIFDQLVQNDLRIYDSIQKIATGQEVDYTSSGLLYYPCFKKTLWTNCNRFN